MTKLEISLEDSTLEGLGEARIERLKSIGIKTLSDLSKAKLDDVLSKINGIPRELLEEKIAQSKELCSRLEKEIDASIIQIIEESQADLDIMEEVGDSFRPRERYRWQDDLETIGYIYGEIVSLYDTYGEKIISNAMAKYHEGRRSWFESLLKMGEAETEDIE